ncbi:hypothetical protein [Absidia glauca]|uniref:SP-RING-type domain-containing protein n=1 Tax=Absidia glauca TaxID=4829 RepID=A0A168NMY1_ABSGL|nr:hypothetical protein [Absidia glauca]
MLNDQDIMDSQQGVSLEDITDRFHLLQHHVDRLPSLTSDTDIVVDMIRKGMSHASNVATDLEELGDSTMLASLEDALKESIDLEYTINQHKAAFMKLRADVGDGLEKFDAYFDQDMQQYNAKSDKDKYYEHEKYTEFKQLVWSVNHPDSPMPALGFDDTKMENGGGDDDDDDVVIAATKKSLKCPLTTTWFENPVTSKSCKHTFSKAAIIGLLERTLSPTVVCPMPGCRQVFDKQSFYDDTLMERLVARAKEAEETNARSEQFHDVV